MSLFAGGGPEPIISESINVNAAFDNGELVIIGTAPQQGQPLFVDPHIQFMDTNRDGVWNPGEVVVYDSNLNRTFDDGEMPIVGMALFGTPTGPGEIPLYLNDPSLWIGDYSTFSTQNGANWEQVPGPPDYFGGSTPSGRPYVVTKQTLNGYLVFFSDRSHVHVAEIKQPTATTKGKPEDASWHRLEGRDASQSKRDEDTRIRAGLPGTQLFNELKVHVDPHAIAVSAFFQISLKQPSGVGFPYDRNSELDISEPIVGTIWMANDGGVYRSTNGGQTWRLLPGLATLPLQIQSRFAGLAVALNPAGGPCGALLNPCAPALYFGVPDNDDFFTLDGGQTWHDDPQEGCGDCPPYFSDPAQPNRVLKSGRFDGWHIYDSSNVLLYPDPRNSLHVKPTIPLPAGSSVLLGLGYLKGYNPIILTPITEQPLPDGDYLLIRQVNPSTRVLLRTTTPTQITDPTDWDLSSTKVSQVGPPLPLNNIDVVDVVQGSGGHRRPVFYVGNGTQVWRWTTGMQAWEPIVDGTSLVARRFFVHPYDPNVIYIIADNAIMRSDNGGQVWHPDISLDRAVTEDGAFSYLGTCFGDRDIVSGTCFPLGNTVGETFVINAMIFDHRHMGTRFAVGNAGVFFTLDGTNWERLLSTTALPGHAVAAYFDGISDPLDQALYVAVHGRGILRISPIPDPDIDGDGDVDRDDLNILLRDLGKSVSQSACGGRCDLNVDGHISDLDAHQLIQMCSRPQCATQ